MRALSLLVILLALAGCRRGPDADELHELLQQSLDTDYQQGLFEVGELSRKGAVPYRQSGDDRARLLIYYDTELVFRQDHQLTEWDTIGVGSLIGVLGATPLGVSGVEPDGNRQGDTLSVYGSTAFADQQGSWVQVPLEPQTVAGSPEVTRPTDVHEDLDLTSRQRRLRRLEQVGAELDRAGEQAEAARFERELERFVAAGECRLAQRDGRPSLATGLPFGEYSALGEALAGVLQRPDRSVCLLPTDGSVENCERVHDGDVAFGLTQSDIAGMAHDGSGLFERAMPMRDLRAVCALYPEAVQLVTFEGNGIGSVADLRGKRVDLGAEGSGIRINALEVLAAAGLDVRELRAARGTPTGEALTSLEAGEVDAVFVTSVWPSRALADLAGREALWLVPLGPALVDALQQRSPTFVPVTIPPNTYPGLADSCPTVAVTSLMITRDEVPDEQVEEMLTALLERVEDLGQRTTQAYHISADRARVGATLPWHAAAERYLERGSN